MMSAVTLFAGHYPLDDIAASNDAEPEHRGSAASYRKNSTAPLSSRGEAMPSKAVQAIKPSILANENILLYYCLPRVRCDSTSDEAGCALY